MVTESEQQPIGGRLPSGLKRLMVGWGVLLLFYPFLLPFTPFAADIGYMVLCVLYFAAAYKLGLVNGRRADKGPSP